MFRRPPLRILSGPMLRKVLLPTIFLFLTYGFWLSPNFKEIGAGVAIFLFGMLSLEEGFRTFTGGILEKILRRTTDKLWKSVSFGVITTTMMQSSSLVSVITISFLSAGLLDLSAGLGIIFGANLGTTTGAWLVAAFGLKVKISAYAMPMLVFGIILVFQNAKTLKGIGYILSGLGFLFLGIHYMKEGFEAFRETIDLTQFAVPGFFGLVLFVGIGVAATVIMQSSHATLVLIITALASEQITYENALALAIGANIGTTITALIGSMSANEQGKRLAGGHLVFNVATGVIAIIFIRQFVSSVEMVSQWVGIAQTDYTLKLAVFHTLFNLVGLVVMLPFMQRLVTFLEKAVRAPKPSLAQPKYLNQASVDFPDSAVQAILNETLHVYDLAIEVIAHGLSLHRTDIFSGQDLEEIVKRKPQIIQMDMDVAYEQKIKGIYSAIIAFISKAAFTWEETQSEKIHWLRNANRDIAEAVKDVKHLRKNMLIYLVSQNPHIKAEYNRLRIQIASVLRSFRQISILETQQTPVLALDVLKVTIEENDHEMNKRLVSLIHDQKITPQMGTSLMNDSTYTYDICKNLISMGETLFSIHNPAQTSVEKTIALSEEEIDAALQMSDED